MLDLKRTKVKKKKGQNYAHNVIPCRYKDVFIFRQIQIYTKWSKYQTNLLLIRFSFRLFMLSVFLQWANFFKAKWCFTLYTAFLFFLNGSALLNELLVEALSAQAERRGNWGSRKISDCDFFKKLWQRSWWCKVGLLPRDLPAELVPPPHASDGWKVHPHGEQEKERGHTTERKMFTNAIGIV